MTHCNQIDCRFCDAEKLLCKADAYLVDRRCVTFRKRPQCDNYRELMKTNLPVASKERHCRSKIQGLLR